MTIIVTLYYKPGNEDRTVEIKQTLADLQTSMPHQLVLMDGTKSPAVGIESNAQLPILQIGPYQLKGQFTPQEIEVALRAAQDRESALQRIDGSAPASAGVTVTNGDRLSLWLSKHYMWVIILALAVYTGLPLLAPTLMKTGAIVPARIIYKIYAPLCHQFAFRSWFLFGEQSFYPSELAEMDNIISYEAWIGKEGIRLSEDPSISNAFIIQARDMLGDERMGYKVALCQRDVAIYGSMTLFGILFALTGRRWKGLSWKWWLIVGIVPIALDGGSQLPGLLSWLPFSLPIRESTPFLRTLTGTLFGIMTAWYLFPVIEESMRETRQMVDWKYAQAQRTREVVS